MKRLLVVALVGCQGGASTKKDAAAKVVADAAIDAAGAAADEPGSGAGSGAGADEPAEPAEPGKKIEDLGAISAWEMVVQRTNYLARRKQHGVAYGTIGPQADPPYVWLVDDTEGNGSLGIRVLLGPKAASAQPGDRVALGGAWQLDDTRHWFWKVDGMDKLPALDLAKRDVKEAPQATPGHAIANGELLPGAKTIGVAKDNDAVYFTVVGPPPATDGDGWQIADELGNPPVALLNLPGERASYGGQDMRTADEHWQLRRGWQYTLRIGHLHKRDGKPAIVNARTPPIRVK